MNNQPGKNEDFLAECTTNVFSLADLRGLRWKIYVSACENSSCTSNDPVLTAYTVALKTDIFCVWRRIPRASTNNNESNTDLFKSPKELIIFWYGEEPVIRDVPGPLLKEVESGAYESRITVDILQLFFKALHNVIEKYLLNGKFIRLGKWFTERIDYDENNNTNCSSLAFSFNIYVHGESTVVATVDIQEKAALRSFHHKDLRGTKSVLLAPYGLDAHLTSHSLPDTDPKSIKVMDEWRKFIPSVKVNELVIRKEEKCPSVVEVMIGDSKVLYPSRLVMVSLTRETGPRRTSQESTDHNVSKVTKKVWKQVKVAEEQHIPKEQLWDFKENMYQSGCGCSSSSNTSRVRNSYGINNPFGSTNNGFSANSNISTLPKNKDTDLSQLSLFHQRQTFEKLRLTPTFSGRLTPSLGSVFASVRPSTPMVSTCREITPLSSIETNANTETIIKRSSSSVTSNLHVSVLSQSTHYTNSELKLQKRNKKKFNYIYDLPFTLNVEPPQLVACSVEPRHQNSFYFSPVTYGNKKFGSEDSNTLSLSDVEDSKDLDAAILPGSKRSGDFEGNDIDLLPKKMKQEINDDPLPRKGPGRLIRRSNVLSPVDFLSDTDSQNGQLSRRTSRRLTSQSSDLVSPSANAQKQHNNDLKTPTTPNDVFDFPVTQSPPHMSFSLPMTSKPPSTTWTRTEDIMPNIADLKNMFDCDEDEDTGVASRKTLLSEAVSSAMLEEGIIHLTTSRLTTTTATALTAHDLAQMFPTPPSQDVPLQTMSPVMSTHTEVHTSSHLHTSMSVLSPEMHHIGSVADCSLDEPRSPLEDASTFTPPQIQVLPIPSMYAPVVLPRRKYKKNIKLKYTPSWDYSTVQPLLLRRQSYNKTSENLELSKSLVVSSSNLYVNSTLEKTNEIETSSVLVQSLVEVLLLADIETTSEKSNSCSFGKFNRYQNLCWKLSPPNDYETKFFPEDVYYPSVKDLTKGANLKDMEAITSSKHSLSLEYIEIFIQNLSSSLSVKYLYLMLSKYYQIHNTRTAENCRSASYSTFINQNKLLKELQTYLEKALIKPTRKSVWDTPKVHGPLSFNKLNSISTKLSVHSAISANPLAFSSDGDILSIAPIALKYWQSLFLEPYSGVKNVAYIVALPDCDFIVSSTKQFFKEFNTIYESLNLGKHRPIVKDLRNGLIRITQKYYQKVSETPVDDWFSQSDSKLMQKLKVVAQFCKHQLGPYLASLTLDSSLYTSKSDSSGGNTKNSSESSSVTGSSNFIPATVYDGTPSSEGKKDVSPTIVVYMVDPFHAEEHDESFPRLWSYVGLMKCFVEMNPHFDKLKENIILQVIPLEQILQLNLSSRSKDTGGSHNAELRNLALSVYARCRTNPLSGVKKNDKCMTGFGTSNNRKNLIQRRQAEKNSPRLVYMAPYILAEKSNFMKTDSHALNDPSSSLLAKEKNVNILFCCYCLSFDDQWLVVTCTDNHGELNETNIIKITYPLRRKNKELIWSVTMRKLWEYIIGVTSYTLFSWRIVLTKLGKVGQAELKEWNLIIRTNLKTLPSHNGINSQSPEACTPCSLDEKRKGQCIFKSISLCNLILDTHIHFVSLKLIQRIGVLVSRVFVTPAPRASSSKAFTHSHGVNVPDSSALLNNAFDDSPERDLYHNVSPMLASPSDPSIFPQTSPEMVKMLSPQFHSGLPLLSPFQPISSKQCVSPSQSTCSDVPETEECLAVGYLLSGCSLTDQSYHPHVLKSDLLFHQTSTNSTSTRFNPLSSTDNLEVLKCILEHFDALSWLTCDPSTGKRTSCLPVHARDLLMSQQLLADICS